MKAPPKKSFLISGPVFFILNPLCKHETCCTCTLSLVQHQGSKQPKKYLEEAQCLCWNIFGDVFLKAVRDFGKNQEHYVNFRDVR